MMRIFMAICCALLTVSPLLARGGRVETARIYRLPRFERAVRCIKFFEGWHTEKHHPYYPKTNAIQRCISIYSDYKCFTPSESGISFDNNRSMMRSLSSQSQRLSHKAVVSFPLRVIKISSGFGYRTDPFTGKRRFHSGIDLQASKGTEAYSMLTGVVVMVGKDRTRGYYVMISHDRYMVTYCHLSRILVRQGQLVEPGEAVGLVGSTGRSTGPHLHLTLRRGKQLINPQILLDCISRILDDETGSQTSGCCQRVCVPRPFSHSLRERSHSQDGLVCSSSAGMTSLYAASSASLFCLESARA